MSWFTDNIRNPIEAAIAGSKPASPSVATANPAPAKNSLSSATQSPYFVPGVLVAIVVLFFVFKHKG